MIHTIIFDQITCAAARRNGWERRPPVGTRPGGPRATSRYSPWATQIRERPLRPVAPQERTIPRVGVVPCAARSRSACRPEVGVPRRYAIRPPGALAVRSRARRPRPSPPQTPERRTLEPLRRHRHRGRPQRALIAAAYLARGGRNVLLVEKNERVGGATYSEEILPGFTVTVFSYVVSLLRPQIIDGPRPRPARAPAPGARRHVHPRFPTGGR